MSNVKKVQTLVACGCICLTVATSASADFLGVKAVIKDDGAIHDLCTLGAGPSVPFPLTLGPMMAGTSPAAPSGRVAAAGMLAQDGRRGPTG